MFPSDPDLYENAISASNTPSQPLCRQGCGAPVLPDHLITHVQTECPMTLVHCPVSYGGRGCLEMVPRSRLESHLGNSLTTHFTTLLGFLQAKDREVIELRSKMDEIIKANEVLREELFEIKNGVDAMKMGNKGNPRKQTIFHGHYRKQFLEGHMRTVVCMSVDDRVLVTGSLDNTVRVWNTLTQENTKCLEGHSGPIRAISMNNGLLATGSNDESIKIWDFETGRNIYTLTGHSAPISGLHFHSPDVLISSSWDQTTKIWKFEESNGWKVTKTTDPCNSRIMSLDSQGDVYATGLENGMIYLWSTKAVSTHQQKTLIGHDGPVRSLQFQGPSVVSGGDDGLLKIWDTSSGELVRTLQGHDGPIVSLRVSGPILVSGGYDKAIRVWDILSGQCIRKIEEHQYSVTSLSLSGNVIVSSANDDRLIIWEFEPPQ